MRTLRGSRNLTRGKLKCRGWKNTTSTNRHGQLLPSIGIRPPWRRDRPKVAEADAVAVPVSLEVTVLVVAGADLGRFTAYLPVPGVARRLATPASSARIPDKIPHLINKNIDFDKISATFSKYLQTFANNSASFSLQPKNCRHHLKEEVIEQKR